MAAVAIDVLDLHWRDLQGMEKPTRLVRRMFRTNPRRACSDRCCESRRRGEDLRGCLLERIDSRRIRNAVSYSPVPTDDSEETVESDTFDFEAYEARLSRKASKRATRAYERRLRREYFRELDEDEAEKAIMFGLETRLRHAPERVPDIYGRRRFLKDFIKFLEGQDRLSDKQLAMLVGHRVELCELEMLVQH